MHIFYAKLLTHIGGTKMISINKNIVLCGFMASGKSSIGLLLANKLNLDFIDTDEYICKKYSMSIPEIFEKGGEELFRDLEHTCTKELSALHNSIISTGGGLLTFERNYEVLKENSIIIFLDRDFDVIYETISNDTNRPLASSNSKEKLKDLYNFRKSKYLNFSKLHIINNKSKEDIVEDIVSKLRAFY